MLCLLLLVSALLLATTMNNLRHVDLGFTAERVLTQSLRPDDDRTGRADARAQFWTRVLEQDAGAARRTRGQPVDADADVGARYAGSC